MSEVRVLRVIARMNLGGPSHNVSILSAGLAERGFSTLLVTGRIGAGEGTAEVLALRRGVALHRLDDLGPEIRPLADLRALIHLVRLVRRHRPQIVHTHTAKAGLLGRAAALAARRPRPVVVHTYHGHVLEGYFGPVMTTFYRAMEWLAGRVSDRLIGVSEATVDDLVRLRIAPRSKFEVVPIGLDLQPFVEASAAIRERYRGELRLGENDVLLSFVGRLVPIKRVDVLIRALAELREAPVHLAVVGDGEIRPALERLAADLGVQHRIRFLGYREDMPAVAAGGDIAVLTSDNEGTPVSLIEAAAAGRPAVATDVGGVRDVVRPEGGLLVDRGDAAGFAEALRSLVDQPGRRQEMGRAAQEWVLRRYAEARLVDDVERLYRRLLAG